MRIVECEFMGSLCFFFSGFVGLRLVVLRIRELDWEVEGSFFVFDVLALIVAFVVVIIY